MIRWLVLIFASNRSTWLQPFSVVLSAALVLPVWASFLFVGFKFEFSVQFCACSSIGASFAAQANPQDRSLALDNQLKPSETFFYYMLRWSHRENIIPLFVCFHSNILSLESLCFFYCMSRDVSCSHKCCSVKAEKETSSERDSCNKSSRRCRPEATVTLVCVGF